jgi:hypothetical protein
MDTPKKHRWWNHLSISVGAFLALVLVIGGSLGGIVRSGRIQLDAVAAIRRAGGQVWYPPNPSNLRMPNLLQRQYVLLNWSFLVLLRVCVTPLKSKKSLRTAMICLAFQLMCSNAMVTPSRSLR